MLVIKVPIHLYIYIWLVVWNMNFIFPFSWEFHHPNWLIFFRGVETSHQPSMYIYIYLISFSRVHRDESHRIQTGQRSAAWKWPSEERTTNTLINLTMDAFQSGFHDGAMENHSLVIKHMAMENPPFSSMTYFFWLKGKIFGNTI